MLEAIEQLQGFEAAAGAWEAEILPMRVANYSPELLDRLCWEGEVTWGRLSSRTTPTETEAPHYGTRYADQGNAHNACAA